MELLESQIGIAFLQEAISDYKDLFLSPLKKLPEPQLALSVKLSGESRDKAPVKQVIVFRAETMEKVETNDFKKYTNQILAPYFQQIQSIFSQRNTENIQFRNCLAKFDRDACALDQTCIYEYQIWQYDSRSGAQSSLVLAKQASKSHLINQEVLRYWAPEFRQKALQISEKAITFFVSLQMLELKQKLVDQTLKVFDEEAKQIDVHEIASIIMSTFNENIFKMQPQRIDEGESIFDE